MAGGAPDGVEREERDVEADFSREPFDGDEHRVAEPDPADQPQAEQPVAGRRLVQVQHESRVERLHNSKAHRVQHVHTEIRAAKATAFFHSSVMLGLRSNPQLRRVQRLQGAVIVNQIFIKMF